MSDKATTTNAAFVPIANTSRVLLVEVFKPEGQKPYAEWRHVVAVDVSEDAKGVRTLRPVCVAGPNEPEAFRVFDPAEPRPDRVGYTLAAHGRSDNDDRYVVQDAAQLILAGGSKPHRNFRVEIGA